MQMMSKCSRTLFTVFAILCTSCAPNAEAPQQPVPAPAQPVTASKAVDLFSSVCLQTAPDFLGAKARMERAGLTDVRSNGANYDATGTVSAKVQARTEAGGISIERCSIVFQNANAASTRSALSKAIIETGIATGPARQGGIGSRIADIWDVRIDGRPARVIFIPARAERLPGGIYFDIPSARASV